MTTVGTTPILVIQANPLRNRVLLKAANGSTIYVSTDEKKLVDEPAKGFLLSTTVAEEFRTKAAIYAVGGDANQTLYIFEE